MSRYDRSPHAGSDRANLYDEITDKIIAELEAGRVPWVQPWGTSTAKAPFGLPKNASSLTTGASYTYVTTKQFLTAFGMETLRDIEALEDAGL